MLRICKLIEMKKRNLARKIKVRVHGYTALQLLLVTPLSVISWMNAYHTVSWSYNRDRVSKGIVHQMKCELLTLKPPRLSQ
jgi:hypothetical protein